MNKQLRKLLQDERKYLYADFTTLHKTQQKLYNEIIKEQNNLLNKFPENETQAKKLIDPINSYENKIEMWVANAMQMEKMEKHIQSIRLKLHAGIHQPSKAFERMGYQENSARIMLETRNERFYPHVFQQLISKITSFIGQNVTFSRGEAKIPRSIDLNLSKKTLQTRKDRLSAEFNALHKESNKWKNDLRNLKEQVLQYRKDLANPDFRRDFKIDLELHHSINFVAGPVIQSIESLHSSMLKYAESLILLNKKEGELFETRAQINGKEQYVNGSHTMKNLNYQRGQALADLKTISKKYYTPEVLVAIDYARDLGAGVLRTVDVDKHVQMNRKLQQIAQLKTKGSFVDRANHAKNMARDFQRNRPTTSNHEKSR
ncbi:hypothetical protein B834_1942 [Enterococcus mundtii 1A]|uniref:hypothetical protein n=1 Tax=Enterococcus mundtii TaxID=53346 RepID=UPI00230317FA|nr:hypothetical protein [Enterococcus mundtii]MDA9429444.1 hypothetical protein [Enterococcus mundtii 1A]